MMRPSAALLNIERRLRLLIRCGSTAILLMAAMAAGCGGSASDHVSQISEKETARTEPSFFAQADAVRQGDSDEIRLETKAISDDDLMAIEALSGLRTLILDHSDNRIGDEGSGRLARLPALGHLRIRGGSIGDVGVRSLASAASLRILNLPQSRISDAGLAELGKLPALEQIRLGSPKITDAGVVALKSFPALKRVHLIGPAITDAALKTFQEMPRLESLYLDQVEVSDAAYNALFQARPDLHVHINQKHHDRDPQGQRDH